MDFISKFKLLDIIYDHDSPSNEGSLLVRELKTGEVLLCDDLDYGDHIEMLKTGEEYEAFFTTLGFIEPRGNSKKDYKIFKNPQDGVLKINAVISDIKNDWYICDAGFFVYAMSITHIDGLKVGDHISVSGGLRIEPLIK